MVKYHAVISLFLHIFRICWRWDIRLSAFFIILDRSSYVLKQILAKGPAPICCCRVIISSNTKTKGIGSSFILFHINEYPDFCISIVTSLLSEVWLENQDELLTVEKFTLTWIVPKQLV